MRDRYDVLAVGAHPDDVEVFMGGTVAKLTDKGLSVLLVDLCSGEPARHAPAGVRAEQAARVAEILGADRTTPAYQDRLILDTPESRMDVAEQIRSYRPRLVLTSEGCGVQPDHKAITEIVTNAVFYARLGSGGSGTLETSFPSVFAVGDVTRIPLALGKPLPMAGVFANRQAELVARNLADSWTGREPGAQFDAHGWCVIETGGGRGGIGKGNFYAEPTPEVGLRGPGRLWHWAKVAYEKWWLGKWL